MLLLSVRLSPVSVDCLLQLRALALRFGFEYPNILVPITCLSAVCVIVERSFANGFLRLGISEEDAIFARLLETVF